MSPPLLKHLTCGHLARWHFVLEARQSIEQNMQADFGIKVQMSPTIVTYITRSRLPNMSHNSAAHLASTEFRVAEIPRISSILPPWLSSRHRVLTRSARLTELIRADPSRDSWKGLGHSKTTCRLAISFGKATTLSRFTVTGTDLRLTFFHVSFWAVAVLIIANG